jgi:glycosyltransferase involved in cell wall biosynthesis
MGRFTPEKRIEWLIEVFNKLVTNKRLVLVGGKTHDKSYYNYIYSLAKTNKNILLTGYVFGKEKKEFLSNCSLFVLPSEVEGLSMALFEALSYGKRVFVGNISGLSNYFTDKKFLFKVNNFEDFEHKLKKMLTSYKNINIKNFMNLNRFISKKEFFEKYIKILTLI